MRTSIRRVRRGTIPFAFGLLMITGCVYADQLDAKLTLQADQPGPIVNRNIYGHFAEHLGRCIYQLERHFGD